MSARPGNSPLAAFVESLAQADDAVKRELAAYLRPYLADSPGRLLDASEKARQLGLHPETLVKMARAGRCRGAIKVGREWRFPSESLEILPPPHEGALASSDLPAALRRAPTTAPRLCCGDSRASLACVRLTCTLRICSEKDAGTREHRQIDRGKRGGVTKEGQHALVELRREAWRVEVSRPRRGWLPRWAQEHRLDVGD